MELMEKIEELFEQVMLTDQIIERELVELSRSTKEIESVIFMKDSTMIGKRLDIGHGDYKSVKYDIVEILKKAQEIDADNIISIHNHPNGTQHPSETDIISFRKMEEFLKKHGIKCRAMIVAGNNVGKTGNLDPVIFTEYDGFTSPEIHTQEFIQKGKDLVKKAVQQGHNIQISDKDVEQKLSSVKNITDFERNINSILRPYNIKFIPVGAE
jgi:proteasome lid subunit RPN8/RPN11